MVTLALRSPAPAGRLRLTLILTTLMAFGSISTDMYLPALPGLAAAFHVGEDRAQLTLSFFLLGFGLGQLFWGPMGDRYGRRGPVIAGIVLYLLGSAGCALSASVEQMIFWRFVQAFGACAAPVLARAMVRDLYGRDQSARMLSILMLVMGVAPLIAPLLGGEVLVWGNWRDIFWMQAAFSLLGLLGVVTMQETLPANQRSSLRVMGAMFSYFELIRMKRFLGYALIGACFYAGIFAYLAGTPFAYITYYLVPAEFYGHDGGQSGEQPSGDTAGLRPAAAHRHRHRGRGRRGAGRGGLYRHRRAGRAGGGGVLLRLDARAGHGQCHGRGAGRLPASRRHGLGPCRQRPVRHRRPVQRGGGLVRRWHALGDDGDHGPGRRRRFDRKPCAGADDEAGPTCGGCLN
jgi:multidrug resistance protein